MPLAASLAAEHRRPGSKCNIGIALSALTGDERDALVDALADCGPGRRLTYSNIVRALKAEGFTVGDNGVSRHVNGGCSCVAG